MNLLVGFYRDPSPARTEEFIECLRRNAANPHIKSITVFLEERISPGEVESRLKNGEPARIQIVEHGQRLTYRHLFEHANRFFDGAGVIIANADIFFDETLALLSSELLAGRMLCLSRWDTQPDGNLCLFDRADSQDAWIFRAPVREFFCNFHMGVPGCDNRLAWEAKQAGLKISNPARTIRAGHLHLCAIRRYKEQDRVSGNVFGIAPEILEMRAMRNDGTRDDMQCVTPPSVNGTDSGQILAVTSLSPENWKFAAQKASIESWGRAGLRVFSFNHPSEISALRQHYDVEWVPAEETSKAVFGRHLLPVSVAARWSAMQNASILFINSDIELALNATEMRRFQLLTREGLCYFVRHNHRGNIKRAEREMWGIDAFLFHGRDAHLVPESFLSFGQPFWDYLLPQLFLSHGRTISGVDFPVAFHREHARQWSWEASWHRCGVEFARVTGELGVDQSWNACMAMTHRVRGSFDARKKPLLPAPRPIREWVEQNFRNPDPKVFLELGAHQGEDTCWMSALPGVTIHAFEPDPRNHQPPRPNVLQRRLAISDRDGRTPFILSRDGWGGQNWTYSSSIKKPKHHLLRYPVTFGETIEVDAITLDAYCRQFGLGKIDFIWADVQGAEGEMIRGGIETLRNTRHLFTAYSDDELYEQQATLNEILALLPDFRVLEIWPENVLLENRRPK